MPAATPNRLASEPSLYLRQHAHNPVDWYPWGPEALQRARVEDKPILLSIGYSSCHWCHVMERECFENPEIASAMNAGFVCIKVDREERPDLDDVYMRVVQMLTGRGGWPMTVFLLPDLRPCYAGTYFPPEDRGGMAGLPRVLTAVSRAFAEERDKLEANGAHLVRLLEEENQLSADATVALVPRATREAFAGARSVLARSMDPEFGGFGRAPKFPSATSLNFLLGLERTDPDPAVHRLLRTTLDRMADGGIYDHLGGGFHRYSVDRSWLIPHFEKMLYDQAQLAETYAEAWLAFGEERYAETAIGVLDYVAREMSGEDRGFFASRDADSEEEEGKFYLWSTADVRALLAERDAEVVCYFFDVTEAGNFESRNILHRTASIEQTAGVFGLSVGELRAILERARSVMYEARKQRVAPVVDTKILADWNGLMLGAMASAARRLGRADLVSRAAQVADFIRSKMIDGRTLKHFCAEGEARVDGFLDDYAFFGRGCLELFQALGRKEDLDTALFCAETILSRFEDKERGGFFRTRDADQELLVRARQTYEGAVPSGASVAIELLCRLYQLTGTAEYDRAARAALAVMLPTALANPHGAAHLLSIAHRALLGYTTVVVVETPGDACGAKALSDAVLRTHAPECSVFALRPPAADWLPSMMRDKAILRPESLAYVCRGHTCESPLSDSARLIAAVRQVS